MESSYLVPIALVLLIIAAGLAMFAFQAKRKTRNHSDVSADQSDDGRIQPSVGADETPFLDTAEHAGTQTSDGRTVAGQDSVHHGGTGRPVSHYGATVPPEADVDSGRSPAAGPAGEEGGRGRQDGHR